METISYYQDGLDEVKTGASVYTISSISQDEILSQMRQLVKDYIAEEGSGIFHTSRQQYQQDFEFLQAQLKDPTLREYASFELMCSLIKHSLMQETM